MKKQSCAPMVSGFSPYISMRDISSLDLFIKDRIPVFKYNNECTVMLKCAGAPVFPWTPLVEHSQHLGCEFPCDGVVLARDPLS